MKGGSVNKYANHEYQKHHQWTQGEGTRVTDCRPGIFEVGPHWAFLIVLTFRMLLFCRSRCLIVHVNERLARFPDCAVTGLGDSHSFSHHLTGITPFVVVPTHDFYEITIHNLSHAEIND